VCAKGRTKVVDNVFDWEISERNQIVKFISRELEFQRRKPDRLLGGEVEPSRPWWWRFLWQLRAKTQRPTLGRLQEPCHQTE
jgi:hypothetical protein